MNRSRTFVPVKRSTLGLVAAAVAFVTWTFSAASLPGWLPPLWSDTNAISRNSILLVGPMVAGVGAWIGGWRHTLAIGPTPARGWAPIMSAQLVPFGGAIVTGHLVGLTPALIDTADAATSGGANPLAILSGGAAILAVAAVGYLLGTSWSSRIAPVVAAVAVFPAIIGPILLGDAVTDSEITGTEGTSLYGIALSWMDITVGIGRRETLIGAAVRITLFAALGVAAVAVAVRAASRDDATRTWSMARPVAAPAAIAAAILLIQPTLVERTTASVCESVPGSELCVPAEVADVIPPLTQGVTQIVDQFGYGAATADIETSSPVSDLVSFYYYAESPAVAESEATISMARLISGQHACLTRAFAEGGDDSLSAGGELDQPYTFATELAYTIATRSNASPTAIAASLFSFETETTRALAELSDADLRAFLDNHTTQLANCAQTSVGP